MQLIGRPFDEATLLRIGAAFQRATDFHDAVADAGVTHSRNAQPARPGSAQSFDLGSADDLLGLMRVERAGAGRPAFRQDLHGEQLGVDFRLEGPGRSDRAVARSSVFTVLSGPKATYQISGLSLRHNAGCGLKFRNFIAERRHPGNGGSSTIRGKIGVVTSGNYG